METYCVFLTKTESKTDLQAKNFWSWIVEKDNFRNRQPATFKKKLIWPLIFTICPSLKTLLILLMDEKFMDLCLFMFDG